MVGMSQRQEAKRSSVGDVVAEKLRNGDCNVMVRRR